VAVGGEDDAWISNTCHSSSPVRHHHVSEAGRRLDQIGSPSLCMLCQQISRILVKFVIRVALE
jgi:hypothetical protein